MVLVSKSSENSKYDGISRGGKNCWSINKGRQDPYCSDGKGLFIYHESSLGCSNNYGKSIDIEQADGKWNWVVDRWVPYYNPQYNICIPLFEHQSPNGGNPNTGKAEYLQEIMFISNPDPCFPWGPWTFSQGVSDNPCSENDNNYFVTMDATGDGLDAYNIGYDQIFSPYTNPRSNSCQSPNTNTGITINLLSQDNNGNIIVKIYFNDAQAYGELPPGKPKNLKAKQEIINTSNGLFHPKLTWDGNSEPDFMGGDLIPSGYYKIIRGTSNTCNPDVEPVYSPVAIVSANYSSWVDEDVFLYPTKNGHGVCSYQYQSYSYKIIAYDNTEAASLPSDRTIINGFTDPCAPNDGSGDNSRFGNETINTFTLLQNYPNPFNPTTEIKFEIPQNTFVTIKIYNAIGEEVASLLNKEYKNAGKYSVNFDGSNLASGIYFYSLEAGTFKDVKKMVLIK
jgi:hypothetical protein